MTQAIQRCAGQQAVGREGLIPFGQVEVAGDDGGAGFVALGDEFVQIFVGRRAKRFESEVINDE